MTMRMSSLGALVLAACCLPVWAADNPLPPVAAETGPKPKPAVRPPAEELDRSITRGVQFLLQRQNPGGSWGSANSSRPDEVYAPIPGAHQGFKAATTALCLSALVEVGGDGAEVSQAIDRGEAWLLAELPKVRRATPDAFYNTWTHAYAIQALVHLLPRKPGDALRTQRIREQIVQQIDRLDRYEVVNGGWAYYDFEQHTQKPSGSTICFVTATVLVALEEAHRAGIDAPPRLIERGKASILRQRKPDFSYFYGEYLKNRPMREINRPSGSLGRSQACNLALRLWGDPLVTDDVLKTWLDRLVVRNGWLDMGRKRPIPHESWCQVAGYFFYYGHYYAARCLELLPPAERPPYQDHLAVLLMAVQEKDGSWWDFPLYDYHQQYGTAFALMSLHRCRR
jgi:hypothetical protein